MPKPRSRSRRSRTGLDPVRLSIFHELFAAIAEEMGEVLRGTAPSVNIRERRDYSCAVFDDGGRLVSQAAHIPVHLGSAALSVQAVRESFARARPGDAFLLNDPYAGGTHLPDLTLVSPAGDARHPWFLVTRAHHSDVGGSQPGSMAPAEDLPAEGLRIPPVRLVREGRFVGDVLALVVANTRTPRLRIGDLRAQVEANRLGARRLGQLFTRHTQAGCRRAAEALHAYTTRLVGSHLTGLRRGRHHARDILEGDGAGSGELAIDLELRVETRGRLVFDFSSSADSCAGSMNANPAVVLAAVLYAICCVVPDAVPVNAGLLENVDVVTRRGSLLDPVFPAAVAGGNVETSQRLVDVCLTALGVAGAPVAAQSAGTMNNLSFGGRQHDGSVFAFYETIGGGAGASAAGPGASGVQTHMTNTRNTPVEECELVLPVTIEDYTLRRGSGGRGRHRGGDGIRKTIRFNAEARVSLLADRRRIGPAGLAGGRAGAPGCDRAGRRRIAAKSTFRLGAGDTLRIETPGGGGFGGHPG